MRKIICAAIATISFFWILGLAGSLELFRIGFTEVFTQGSIACILLYSSARIGGFIE